jgi:uncharacterized integral membrane protein
MRILCFLLLVIFVAAVVAFAVQNRDDVSIQFLEYRWAYPLALVVAAAYVLGMLTGWSVVGIVRRSVGRVTERRDVRA